ncbi:MAG: DUF3307 domain-containing protein [Actinomycetota bacterium]|nr:DUF3307 domain-containing protein [Actinomycetota bacterium]
MGVTMGVFADTFAVLIVLHSVGDWLLQTDWMAKGKAKSWPPLVAHVAVWTACMLPAAVWLFDPIWLLWLAGTHLVLDGTDFVRWWMTAVKRVPEADLRGSAWWLVVVADQVFHLLTLVPVAATAG